MVIPLRVGAASFVVYRNGTSNIIAWGPHDHVTGDIASVRQNLNLWSKIRSPFPDCAPQILPSGRHRGNAVYVSRSGVGITADGALVYVGGPDSTSPIWRTYWCAPVRCAPWNSTSTSIGSTSPTIRRRRQKRSRVDQWHRAREFYDGITVALLRVVVGRDFITLSARSTSNKAKS